MSSIEDALKHVKFIKTAPFGSRVVGCAREDSDFDYLVLVRCRPSLNDMRHTAFLPDADDPLYGNYFSSWRCGNINLVFTDNSEYYEATLEACNFCRKYKVYDKADRCTIHEKFRDAIATTTHAIFSTH